MLYLGIDQHKRQLTVNLRGEDGSVILKRQVSTQWEKVQAFFADLAEKARRKGGFIAILEVCGMNPWLLEMLTEYGCRETVVLQPTERSKQKTDSRDADGLSRSPAVRVARPHITPPNSGCKVIEPCAAKGPFGKNGAGL